MRSAILSKAIEEAYRPFLMTHRYPFTALVLTVDSQVVDVNVHPTKMEVRFSDQPGIYDQVYQAVKEGLAARELIRRSLLKESRRAPRKKKNQLRKRSIRSPLNRCAASSLKNPKAPIRSNIPRERLLGLPGR